MPASRKKKNFFRSGLTSKKLLRYFLFVASCLLLIGAGLRLLSLYTTRAWQGDERFTVVLVGGEPVVISYQDGVGLTTIPIPASFEVTASFNVGQLRVGSLYELGEIQGIGGGNLVSKTLQGALGLPIDGWVTADAGDPIKIILAKNTNLVFFDRVRIAQTILTTPQALVRNLSPIPVNLPRSLVDIKVAQENVGIGVINSAGEAGLGRRVTKVLEGMGATVLWVKTQDSFDSRCIVRTSRKIENSLTVEKITRLFSCKIEHDEKLSSSVELILGREIAQEFP